jgi:signal-transduction protein with cAMP-binding, CBS, and nucleotidyltransferase domain
LINYTIPPLKLTDKVDRALAWMSEFHLHELPVVEDGRFLGLFNENLLFDQDADSKEIKEVHLINAQLYVDQDEHYYEVLKKAYDAHANVVAVTNEEAKFIGVVTIQDVVTAFSKMSSIQSPGSIIVLTMPAINYSMTDISRIVESEGGKILSSFVENDEGHKESIRLTLKLNTENSSNIISSFERYQYRIESAFGSNRSDSLEEERLNTLLHYLKI